MNEVVRIDALPGFRRRFVVDPAPGRVQCDLEDDYHHMRVVVRHDGEVATGVEAEMIRVPWTTCGGAQAVLAGGVDVCAGIVLPPCTVAATGVAAGVAPAFEAAPEVALCAAPAACELCGAAGAAAPFAASA